MNEDGNIVFVHAESVICCDLDGGKALLDSENSQYYKLNDTAALIWETLSDGNTVNAIAKILCHKFEVNLDQAIGDTKYLLSSLQDAKLINQKN